ncbi:hypothetical protein [Jannaschia ovalis]|uniref:Uncharacterized protein n=1 Tax=Jannaschia ovalis TaxID=3038773 RepID=A0ABY8LE04_9RHOB|nr:hypothetical protein [Jannaschia sp. GRR-S6-38]WGH78525.1 hypothetical protein P8627_16140 [Jannaschia sp. GRR-S6-38]
MARKIIRTVRRIERDPVTDVLGGVWLVTLLLGLLNLPALLA